MYIELAKHIDLNDPIYSEEYTTVSRLVESSLFSNLIVHNIVAIFKVHAKLEDTPPNLRPISNFNVVLLKYCLCTKVRTCLLKDGIEFYLPDIGKTKKYESNNKKELNVLYTAMCKSDIFEYNYIAISDVLTKSEIKEIQEVINQCKSYHTEFTFICGHFVLPSMLIIGYANESKVGTNHSTKDNMKRAYALLYMVAQAGITFTLEVDKENGTCSLCRVCGTKNKNREGRYDIDITEGMYFAIMRARLEHKYPDGLFNTIS